MKMTRAALLTLLVSFFACTAVFAKVSVFLKDGGEVRARKVWQDDGMVQVLVNRDTLVEFDESEVDLAKTKLKAKPRSKLLDQVIEISGTQKQLENLLKRSSTDDEFDKILKENFDPAMAVKVVRRNFAKKLSEQHLTDVLAWLKSPTGRKITEAEALSDSDDKDKVKAFMDREATPEMKERLLVLAEIDRSMGVAEMERSLASRMIKRIAKAIPADFPDRAVVLDKINDNIPTVETLRKQNAAKSAYTLRDVSTAELRDYLRFLQSPAGTLYSAATVNAAQEILGPVMNILADRLSKELSAMAAAQRSDAAAASPAEICTFSAREGKKKLPIKVDAVTTATDITCEATTLVYRYRILNSYADTFLENQAAKEAGVKNHICGHAGLMGTHISKGVSIAYSYQDEAGKPLAEFIVTPKDCGV